VWRSCHYILLKTVSGSQIDLEESQIPDCGEIGPTLSGPVLFPSFHTKHSCLRAFAPAILCQESLFPSLVFFFFFGVGTGNTMQVLYHWATSPTPSWLFTEEKQRTQIIRVNFLAWS
jgi:hypothetical protein